MVTTRRVLAAALIAVGASVAAPFPIHGQVAEITVLSGAFEAGQPIPLRFAAYGENVSPSLSWDGLPEGTRSLALVMDDPDAPMPQPFVHWVVYNIPATASGLPEGIPAEAHLHAPAEIAGTTQGLMGLRQPRYFGPRPPAGKVHHYNFTLYALDADLSLPEVLGKAELLERIQGHVIGEGRLIGTYEHQG
jgi:Raf kinase inhibitor-like YbhB/YbcL family protein